MLHNVALQAVSTYGAIAVGPTFQGQFQTELVPFDHAPIAGRTDVSLVSQLYACLTSRITPLKNADDIASAAFLTFFGSYLVFHIISAWPHISAALQGGGAL